MYFSVTPALQVVSSHTFNNDIGLYINRTSQNITPESCTGKSLFRG